MLGKSHVRFVPPQSKQVTDDDSLSNVKEVAKRRCNREQHSNRAQSPDVGRGLSIYGCFHLR